MPTRRKRWLMENDGYQEMGTCSRESFSVLPFFTIRRACGYEVWIYFKAHTHSADGPLPNVFSFGSIESMISRRTPLTYADVLRNDELREHLDHVQMMHR